MRGEVLVIEDDRTLNHELVDHLDEQGFAANGVNNWSLAEDYLREHEPKYVIMDVRLPDADGMERLGSLASEYPVIVLTAYGSIDDAVLAMNLDSAVARTYIAQSLDPPCYSKKVLITNQVTTHFFDTQIESTSYTLHARPTAGSRMKMGAAEYLTKPVTLDELDLVIERVLDNANLRKTNQFYRSRLGNKGRNVIVQKYGFRLSRVERDSANMAVDGA